MTFFKVLFITFYLYSSLGAGSECSGFNSDDLLQSGIIEFDRSSDLTCREVDIKYKVPSSGFQVAVSTSDLNNYKPKSGLDYSVRAGAKNEKNDTLSITLIVEDKSWRKITVAYLISSNPNVYLGSFIVDAYSLFGCESGTNSEAITKYVEVSKKSSNYQVGLFVSGVKTNDSTVFVDLRAPSYNPKASLLEFTLKVNSRPSIENIHISYVIWDKSSISISSFNPDKPSQANYQIMGVSQLTKSVAEYGGLEIDFHRLECVGRRCEKDCISAEDCKKWKGLINKNICFMCGTNEKIAGNECVPDCKQNEIFVKGKCECQDGYIRFGEKCRFKCGINEIWKNGDCVCKDGHAKIDGVCRQCPPYSQVSSDKKSCICEKYFNWNPKARTCDKVTCPAYSSIVQAKNKYICKCDDGYVEYKNKCVQKCGDREVLENGDCVCDKQYVDVKGVCKQCPKYSTPSKDGKQCVCSKNYYWNKATWKCDYLVCGDGASVVFHDGSYKCTCEDGYEYEYGKCVVPIRCPTGAVWNQRKLQCECKKSNEHLIDNECRQCGENQGWNGQKCVCQTGFYKIKGVCKTCDPNTYYNGRDCICNHGWYGNADLCKRCHETCGQCEGPYANQCTRCSDVSYDLVKGKCTRNVPCPTGLYHDGKQCKPCSSYCSKCESESVCVSCIQGFQVEKISYAGVDAAFCSEICGDGRRFQLDCDDGNTKNGDGCSSSCEVEKGYTCQGGSSIKASHCVDFTPSRTFITLKGSVHLYGRIVQGIRMSYVPPSLTDNQCAKCSQMLWVRVINSQVVPGVRIKYLPGSKYQFLAEFEFHGLFAIPVFSISIQLNPDFREFFADADMAQVKIKTIDPAVLAKSDKHAALTFNDISSDPTSIDIAQEDVDQIFY